MTRVQRRAIKKEHKVFKELIKVMRHFFPNLIEKFATVKDLRHKSYIEYGTDEILITILLGYMMAIGSMRKLTEKFDKDECIENIRKILKNTKIEEIPHYDTINDFLEILGVEELEEIRTYMIKSFIEKRCFDNYKFLKKDWLVIVDASGLYHFKERHCEHCLTKTYNKGKEDEYTLYYHNVLEAKLLIGSMVFSIETEFIENENPDVEKQDCELNAFERLAEKMKRKFPRLPICILGDSLYACERLFKICESHRWNYIIRFKEGRIKTIAKEFESIKKIEEKELKDISDDKSDIFIWANGIYYNDRVLSLLEMTEIIDEKSTRFVWLSNIEVKKSNAVEVANAGRRRWKIENQGFNTQKNSGYNIEHTYSLNYNAMKNHYLLCQIAHMIRQLFENGISYLKELKIGLNNISSDLLESFRNALLTTEDMEDIEKRIQIRFV